MKNSKKNHGGPDRVSDGFSLVRGKSVEDAFAELIEYIVQFDPIELLCNLSLTYLRHDVERFVGADDVSNRWVVRTELIAGILLTRRYISNHKPRFTGAELTKLERLIIQYEDLVFSELSNENQLGHDSVNEILRLVQIHSHCVRGIAYPHQYNKITHETYSPHDVWFKGNLGFTIEEAIALANSCVEQYNLRINQEKVASKTYAVDVVKNLDMNENDKRQLEQSLRLERFFGRANEYLGFSVDDIARASGLPKSVCNNILQRLSQPFGYRNPSFMDTYENSMSALWDFSTLNERPFLRHDNKYWILLPATIKEALMSTFYFDLMKDTCYRPQFEKTRGKWLEEKTATCLKRVFGEKSVHLNPFYPNGHEMADVLVMFEESVLIIQCKSKGLTFAASRGNSLEELRKSLELAVKSAYQQGDAARRYLLNQRCFTLHVGNKQVKNGIDRSQIRRVYLVVVTATRLHFFATSWASVNAEFRLFQDGDYPWALSVTDLEALSEILSNPVDFIHYMDRRIQSDRVGRIFYADEMDFLATYLSQGLCLEDTGRFGLAGMSRTIDEYMYFKHTLKRSVNKPSAPEPEGFREFVDGISHCPDPFRSDVAFAVLDLGEVFRVTFMDAVNRTIECTKRDGRVHCSPTQIVGKTSVLAFVSMNANGNHRTLYNRILAHASWIGYEGKFSQICTIGWDLATDNAVDSVCVLADGAVK